MGYLDNLEPSDPAGNFHLNQGSFSVADKRNTNWRQNRNQSSRHICFIWKHNCVDLFLSCVDIAHVDPGIHPDNALGRAGRGPYICALQGMVEQIKLLLVLKTRILQRTSQTPNPGEIRISDNNRGTLHGVLPSALDGSSG